MYVYVYMIIYVYICLKAAWIRISSQSIFSVPKDCDIT